MRIALLTHYPAPHQIQLLDQVERERPGALCVFYLHRTDPTRAWPLLAPRHEAHFLKDGPQVLERARDAFRDADLAIFNYYNEAPVPELLKIRVATRRPWTFWGERTGFTHPHLGRIARRWTLRALHREPRAIWGIGKLAVDSYRREFGGRRPYVNLPYFSDLDRFAAIEVNPPTERTFLYSGSLSSRKGVDLLARAFRRVAESVPHARLRILAQDGLEKEMRAELAPCEDRVQWIRNCEWKDLHRHYTGSHVLVAPSRHDGWGLVVPEGLASGLPVISTDRTGAAVDLIAPGSNGWIAAAGSEESLHAAMLAAATLGEPDWRAMSTNARKSVENHTLHAGAGRFLDAADAALRA